MSLRSLIPDSNSLESFVPGRRRHASGAFVDVVDVQEAYVNGFHGCFVDSDESPDWCRQIAKYARDEFRDAHGGNNWLAEQVMPSNLMGTGAGKRAINFAYIMKVMASALAGAQSMGNCVAWAERELSNTLVGMAIAAGDMRRMDYRHGTALVYGSRGTMSQGMDLGTAAQIVSTIGQSEEKDYGNGLDLSTQSLDENAGNKWGRGGPPQALKDAVKGDTIKKTWYIQDLTADLLKDALYNEGVINTGSTWTGKGPANPVCAGLKSIGGHSQACLGYDDTDEFRAWYQQTAGSAVPAGEFAVIMDQSWPPNWIALTNWPEHLWGPRPEGAWVLWFKHFVQLCGGRYGECQAQTGVNGFVPRRLPDWGTWSYL